MLKISAIMLDTKRENLLVLKAFIEGKGAANGKQ